MCDDKLCKLAYEFYRLAQSQGIESSCFLIKPRQMHGQEPPAVVAEALKKADAALLFTSMSLSHTKARKIASKKYGTRIGSLPGVTLAMLNRAICLNYSNLAKKTTKLANSLTKAKKIEVYTEAGTHLTMSVKGRRGFSDNGLYIKSGAFGNLPAGEACISPLEGTANGQLVIDGSAPFLGKLKKSLKIKIKNGYAENVPIAKMRPLVHLYGRKILNVAELGIGLNPKAKVTGSILEDEKSLGTAHIAFGNNKSFGGRVSCPSHLDFVFLKPTVIADGIKIKI